MSTVWTSRALRALAFACPWVTLWWLRDLSQPQLDEWVHVGQVEMLLAGGTQLHERLTVAPGLHLVVAGLSAAGVQPLWAGRIVVATLSAVMLLAAYGLASRLCPDRAELRVLALALFPLSLPLMAVFYTDVPALACLMLAVLAAHRGRAGLASVALVAMLAFRHSMAGFVPFVFILSAPPDGDVRRWLRRAWPILIPLALLAVVLWAAGGAALGDARNHPVGLFGANLPFAAALALVLFLPTHLRALPDVIALARRAPVACLVSSTVGLALALGTDATHPFNDPSLDRLLYVSWIDALFHTGPGRVVLALASVYVPLSFASWRWRLPRFGWLAPFAVARLSISWLVEPRYALPFLALVLVARPKEPRWVEGLYAVGYAGASWYLMDGLARELWFPL